MTYYNKRPKITWGTSFANTLSIGYPVDNWSSWSEPRQGSVWVQSMSGDEDSWIIGTDYYLQVDVRWIPTANTTSPVATGWDGTTGFRAFLEWAKAKNVFRWYPDKDSASYVASYLVDPMNGGPTVEPDGTKRITLVIRNATTAYDGY